MVRKKISVKVDGPIKKRGRPKKKWMEVSSIDKCNLTKYLRKIKCSN